MASRGIKREPTDAGAEDVETRVRPLKMLQDLSEKEGALISALTEIKAQNALLKKSAQFDDPAKTKELYEGFMVENKLRTDALDQFIKEIRYMKQITNALIVEGLNYVSCVPPDRPEKEKPRSVYHSIRKLAPKDEGKEEFEKICDEIEHYVDASTAGTKQRRKEPSIEDIVMGGPSRARNEASWHVKQERRVASGGYVPIKEEKIEEAVEDVKIENEDEDDIDSDVHSDEDEFTRQIESMMDSAEAEPKKPVPKAAVAEENWTAGLAPAAEDEEMGDISDIYMREFMALENEDFTKREKVESLPGSSTWQRTHELHSDVSNRKQRHVLMTYPSYPDNHPSDTFTAKALLKQKSQSQGYGAGRPETTYSF